MSEVRSDERRRARLRRLAGIMRWVSLALAAFGPVVLIGVWMRFEVFAPSVMPGLGVGTFSGLDRVGGYAISMLPAAIGVWGFLNLAALFGIIAQPIIPTAAKKILDALNIPEENRNFPAADADFAGLLDALPHGMAISPPDVLFQKIEDAQVAEGTERFGGGREN